MHATKLVEDPNLFFGQLETDVSGRLFLDRAERFPCLSRGQAFGLDRLEESGQVRLGSLDHRGDREFLLVREVQECIEVTDAHLRPLVEALEEVVETAGEDGQLVLLEGGVLLLGQDVRDCRLEGFPYVFTCGDQFLFREDAVAVLLAEVIDVFPRGGERVTDGDDLLAGEVESVEEPADSGDQTCGAFAWLLYTLLGRDLYRKYNPVMASIYVFAFGVIACLPGALSEETFYQLAEQSWAWWGCISYMGVAATAFGVVAFNTSIRILGAGKTAMFLLIVPPTTNIWGYLLFNEPATWIKSICIVVVLFGVWLAIKRPRTRAV